MPLVYLSPSTQEFNSYYTEGTEEQYMNYIADALEPYLERAGIDYVRNTPEMTAASSIAQSNASGADLHVAIHSNASSPELSGLLSGTDIYYNPSNPQSRDFAGLLQDEFRQIYYEPDNVEILPTGELGEVLRTRAPSVLIETAYHDNPTDEQWIKNNIDPIAQAIARAVELYFARA